MVSKAEAPERKKGLPKGWSVLKENFSKLKMLEKPNLV
jgi:hypothetical protein